MNATTYISGATGYLGRIITENLAQRNFDLLLSARNEGKLAKLLSDLLKRYPSLKVSFIVCDLENKQSWQQATKELSKYNVVTYINCSGIQGKLGPSINLLDSDIDSVLQVNLLSSIHFSQFFASHILPGSKLNIIHFSGGGATSARPNFLSYSLSKTALIRFVENFALENKDGKIQINAVAPGVLPSKMQSEVLESAELYGSSDYEVAANSKTRSTTDHSKVLELCSFLLSERSQGITGKLISAEWDNWSEWPNHLEELNSSDLYTLRRIVGRDRGDTWGDI